MLDFCSCELRFFELIFFNKCHTREKPVSKTFGMGFQASDQEGRTITVEYEKFYFITTYIMNSGQGMKRIDERTKKFEPKMRKYRSGALFKNFELPTYFPRSHSLFCPQNILLTLLLPSSQRIRREKADHLLWRLERSLL